jgi:hypothetical protein
LVRPFGFGCSPIFCTPSTCSAPGLVRPTSDERIPAVAALNGLVTHPRCTEQLLVVESGSIRPHRLHLGLLASSFGLEVHPRKCVTKVHSDRPHLLDSEPFRTARAVEMVDIGRTGLVGGMWHGGGFKFHFNLLRDVIGHFFCACFLSTTRGALRVAVLGVLRPPGERGSKTASAAPGGSRGGIPTPWVSWPGVLYRRIAG